MNPFFTLTGLTPATQGKRGATLGALRKSYLTLLSAALVLATPALAQTASEHNAHHPAPPSAATAGNELTDGEVRKIDLDAAKITLKHSPIKSLDMPSMTMVFQVSDPALLGRVKAGDKVRFSAVNEKGRFVVTAIEAAK